MQTDLADAGLIGDPLRQAFDPISGLEKKVQDDSDEVFSSLISLALNESTVGLNKRAEALEAKLRTRYLEHYPSLVQGKDMKEVEKSIREIYEPIKTLPKLTPEEVDAEYKALPEEPLQR
jgi:hypothetical protein